ncbi:MAG: phenylacetate--CoA ligase family protein [Planctomycetota bacterium]
MMLDRESRDRCQRWSRDQLEQYQVQRFNQLLEVVYRENAYYRQKFEQSPRRIESLAELSQFPFSTKAEWINEGPDGVALHHSYAMDRYRRYHRTSGTRGRPMVVLDTDDDWNWWLATWQYVLDACHIEETDRVLMAFSFGPFIGFWSAHDACLRRRCMVIPSGGMSTTARIELIRSAQPTVLFSTPTYAIHLGQEAERCSQSLRDSNLRTVFVAGEPGGSVPSVRAAIESLYGAQVMDHAGATEIGPWGFGSPDGRALHIIETEFIAEFLLSPFESGSSIATSNPTRNPAGIGEGELYELVLTSLGRTGAPVIRYRTGDLVRPVFPSDSRSSVADASGFVRLEGGVVGRADDMFVVRGVNIFPSSIDALVREFPEIGEYRLTLSRTGALDELVLELEDPHHNPARIEERLLARLQLRVRVVDVPAGSLPKSEGKSRRIVDRR